MPHLSLPDGRAIAYEAIAGSLPGVFFLTGFKSDMTGAKAQALAAHCRAQGTAFTRFDYTGHGQSSGRFEDGTIGAWLQDALDVFDRLAQGPQVVVGSSMGGWLMLLLALRRRERVAGLVGLASAPDFTERLIWERFNEAQKAQMLSSGAVGIPNCYDDAQPYLITRALIEEGRSHLLLHDAIPIECPVRLLHGTADEDVPHRFSQELMHRLASKDVRLTLIKDGSHRLSEPAQLELLCDTVEALCGAIVPAPR